MGNYGKEDLYINPTRMMSPLNDNFNPYSKFKLNRAKSVSVVNKPASMRKKTADYSQSRLRQIQKTHGLQMESPVISNIKEESKIDSGEKSSDHQIFNKSNMHRKTVSSTYK